MKRTILASALLLLLFLSSFGQWYVKKYNVTDINLLTKEQLQESWTNASRSIGSAAIVAGTGATFMILNILFPIAPSDDPTWMEELFGYKWKNDVIRILSAGLIAGGTLAIFAYLGRIARIKSVLKKDFPSSGSLNISSALVLNNSTRSFCPGFRVSFNF